MSQATTTTNVVRRRPANSLVGPLLTDLYQLTMTYSYWKTKRHEKHAVFDLFFRKNPFQGEYTIFAGLEEVLSLLDSFAFTPQDIEYLKTILPHDDLEFFDWLVQLDCSQVKLYALQEGSVTFPRIPVLRVEGPLGVCQLLETPLLNLLNYASLIATNATRFRKAAGKDIKLLEFGLRRAQGPDGGMSASKYSYMAGFDGTSNVLAGKIYGIPVKGTHAHSYVQSFVNLDEIKDPMIGDKNVMESALRFRRQLGYSNTNEGELAAFLSYAQSFPNSFLALVDTYDTLASGVPNFLCVALALHALGYKPLGIRLDSGDLSYLSKEVRKMFIEIAEAFDIEYFKTLNITASNDINEAVVNALNEQGHCIDSFGIGTHLVTCQAQPALGMVYKLVQVNGEPRIKLSQDVAKVTLPGRKEAYRLIGDNGKPILDLLIRCGEATPVENKRMLCRHPFDEMRRVFVTPSKVVPLHSLVWDGPNGGICPDKLPTIQERRDYVREQVELIREDVMRPLNATPYKVSVSPELYTFIHELWMREIPIAELS